MQVTSLPSFAFSNLPQPDTSKLLANLEQKTKQMMTPTTNRTGSDSPSTSATTTTDVVGSSGSTTTSLRAMRKQPSAATSTNNFSVRKNTNANQMITASAGGTPILANHPTLSLPIVALPTKPLPVQMTPPPPDISTNETNKSLVQGFNNNNNNNNGTSIQITALIQSSNPNAGDYIGQTGSSVGLGSPSDFMVQASTQVRYMPEKNRSNLG